MYKMSYKHREDIFHAFSKKINVESLGKSCNNVNIKFTRNVYNKDETYNDIAVEIYSKYKFVLAIENTIKNEYYTEKLINPILANTIPIYYGSNSAFKLINKKRVIYFNDYKDINTLIDFIIELSNNEEKYNEIINENIFSIDELNLNNYNEFIKNLINDIINKYFYQNCNIYNNLNNDDSDGNKLNLKKINYLKIK
jgi:DNA-binding MltR family transcriptional regulator